MALRSCKSSADWKPLGVDSATTLVLVYSAMILPVTGRGEVSPREGQGGGGGLPRDVDGELGQHLHVIGDELLVLLVGDHVGVLGPRLLHGLLHEVVDVSAADQNLLLAQCGGHYCCEVSGRDELVAVEVIQLEGD
eukprot:scaffold437_cov168-Ochromonas_danica.AAC.44